MAGYGDFNRILSTARRKARLGGRTLTEKEHGAMAEGAYGARLDRRERQRALNIQQEGMRKDFALGLKRARTEEKALKHQKKVSRHQLEEAKKQRKQRKSELWAKMAMSLGESVAGVFGAQKG